MGSFISIKLGKLPLIVAIIYIFKKNYVVVKLTSFLCYIYGLFNDKNGKKTKSQSIVYIKGKNLESIEKDQKKKELCSIY